jgi:hypothetical protein
MSATATPSVASSHSRQQHVLGKRSSHLEGVTGRARVAEGVPQHGGDDGERDQAGEHREIDPQIQATHQSCCLANT